MIYRKMLISGLTLAALIGVPVSAAELFNSHTSNSLLTNTTTASQFEVEQMRASNNSISDSYIYNLNAQVLTADTSELTVNLTPSVSLDTVKLSATQSASGGMVWTGTTSSLASTNQLSSDPAPTDDSVTLVLRNGKITGTVRTNGRLFKIMPLKSGQHLVVEIDESNMKPDHPAGAMQTLESEMQNQVQLLVEPTSNSSVSSVPVIRVLVVYSNGLPNEVADIPALVDLAIAETNQGYANSGVSATIELAHLQAVNYTETTISTDLTRLKSTSDGYMDEVHGWRDQHAADVVMLLVPDSGSSCGKAAAIGASESSAFAVTAQDCATGYYSFGHELGHLQSARHDPDTDGTNSPYAFGHGYRDPASAWRTVMAYNCSSGCSRINWWSNPNKTRSGTPMGTSSRSDNTRVLNLTAATVAGFRDGDVIPPPTDNELENGVAKTGLSGAKGSELRFTLAVPAGATELSFDMLGSSGDADLYVSYGSAPTATGKQGGDCVPYKNGSNETCNSSDLDPIQEGVYHVLIHGYSAYSNVELTASFTQGTTPPTAINRTENNIAVDLHQWKHFTQVLPAGYATFTVSMSGGSNDADLYVKKGSQPTVSNSKIDTASECVPYVSGSIETCSFNSPAADTWYISVYGYQASTGGSLTITANP